LPHSTASASRFSQPPDAFVRPEPAGLISCQIRSWGRSPELSSSRVAARRFRRRSPLDIGTTHTESPCLQGFAPRESSPPDLSVLNRNPARSSPEPFSLQGFHSFCDDLGLHQISLLVVTSSDENGRTGSTSRFFSQQAWLVSLETADPHGIFCLLTHHDRSRRKDSGVASSCPGVRHHPLARLSLNLNVFSTLSQSS